jgi:hypothetical protein
MIWHGRHYRNVAPNDYLVRRGEHCERQKICEDPSTFLRPLGGTDAVTGAIELHVSSQGQVSARVTCLHS